MPNPNETITLDILMKDIKNGHSKIIRDKNLNSMIGEEVTVGHGEGYIIGVEYFKKGRWSDIQYYAGRYVIKVTNNIGKPILKSLFPNNELCYNIDEIEFKNKLKINLK